LDSAIGNNYEEVDFVTIHILPIGRDFPCPSETSRPRACRRHPKRMACAFPEGNLIGETAGRPGPEDARGRRALTNP